MVNPLDMLTGCSVQKHISRELSMLAHPLRCWAQFKLTFDHRIVLYEYIGDVAVTIDIQ